jgi:hypothetical protein
MLYTVLDVIGSHLMLHKLTGHYSMLGAELL